MYALHKARLPLLPPVCRLEAGHRGSVVVLLPLLRPYAFRCSPRRIRAKYAHTSRALSTATGPRLVLTAGLSNASVLVFGYTLHLLVEVPSESFCRFWFHCLHTCCSHFAPHLHPPSLLFKNICSLGDAIVHAALGAHQQREMFFVASGRVAVLPASALAHRSAISPRGKAYGNDGCDTGGAGAGAGGGDVPHRMGPSGARSNGNNAGNNAGNNIGFNVGNNAGGGLLDGAGGADDAARPSQRHVTRQASEVRRLAREVRASESGRRRTFSYDAMGNVVVSPHSFGAAPGSGVVDGGGGGGVGACGVDRADAARESAVLSELERGDRADPVRESRLLDALVPPPVAQQATAGGAVAKAGSGGKKGSMATAAAAKKGPPTAPVSYSAPRDVVAGAVSAAVLATPAANAVAVAPSSSPAPRRTFAKPTQDRPLLAHGATVFGAKEHLGAVLMLLPSTSW